MTNPGDKHYTASVLFITEETPRKVLLVHHKKLDRWIQPGGHQEAGENYYEAAIREAREETGIHIAPYLPKPETLDEYSDMLPRPDYILEEKIPAHGAEPEHFHLDMTFIVRLPEQPVVREESGAHDLRWFTAEEIETISTFEELRITLRRELAR